MAMAMTAAAVVSSGGASLARRRAGFRRLSLATGKPLDSGIHLPKVGVAQLLILRCHNGSHGIAPGFKTNAVLKNEEGNAEIRHGEHAGSYAAYGLEPGSVVPPPTLQNKTGAKIHDFCLGIPFGGLIIGGGLVEFMFIRNSSNLLIGTISGGAILTLSVLSLKIWKQGRSSVPLIFGQIVVAAMFLWKVFQAYSLKKSIPSGIFLLLSATMLCFYSYVILAGGNPPSKKLQASEKPSR